LTNSTNRPEASFQAISDWLVDVALGDIDLETLFPEFCNRILDAGIHLTHAHLATRSLHPMFVAGTITWERESRLDVVRITPAGDDSEGWKQSPLYALLHSRGFEARHSLIAGDGWREFPILVELRERGATDYYAQIVIFGSPEQAWARQDGCIFSWAIDHPDGYSDDQIAALRWLGNRFGIIAKLDRREQTAINVVTTYLGAEAGRRVLDGQIKLGDGEVIPAVIWYSDMRRSTALADSLSGAAFLGILNDYFQCTAGAVLDQGGEVLQFIGDAVLAIFHVDGNDGSAHAARLALAASRDAEKRLAELNARRKALGEQSLDFGLALHLGELMFGNIGVPERVDFSVIGPTVNEVARLENLTKELKRPILVSKPFADLLPLNWESLGSHQVQGVRTAMVVYAPPDI
jgi:adenylate cyclase